MQSCKLSAHSTLHVFRPALRSAKLALNSFRETHTRNVNAVHGWVPWVASGSHIPHTNLQSLHKEVDGPLDSNPRAEFLTGKSEIQALHSKKPTAGVIPVLIHTMPIDSHKAYQELGLDEDEIDYSDPRLDDWRMGVLDECLKSKPDLAYVDVVAFHTRYTHRVQEFMEACIDADNDPELSTYGLFQWFCNPNISPTIASKIAFVQTDLIWVEEDGVHTSYGDTERNLAKNTDALKMLTDIKKDGCVGFTDFSMTDVFSCVDEIGSIEFCGCCSQRTVMDIQWYKYGSKTIAIVDMDTESG